MSDIRVLKEAEFLQKVIRILYLRGYLQSTSEVTHEEYEKALLEALGGEVD